MADLLKSPTSHCPASRGKTRPPRRKVHRRASIPATSHERAACAFSTNDLLISCVAHTFALFTFTVSNYRHITAIYYIYRPTLHYQLSVPTAYNIRSVDAPRVPIACILTMKISVDLLMTPYISHYSASCAGKQ